MASTPSRHRARAATVALVATLMLTGCLPESPGAHLVRFVRHQVQLVAGTCVDDPNFFFPQQRPLAAGAPIDQRLQALQNAGLLIASKVAKAAASPGAQMIESKLAEGKPQELQYELTAMGKDLFTPGGLDRLGGRFCIGRPDIDAVTVVLRRAFQDGHALHWGDIQPWARTIGFRTAFPEVDDMVVPEVPQLGPALAAVRNIGEEFNTLLQNTFRRLHR